MSLSTRTSVNTASTQVLRRDGKTAVVVGAGPAGVVVAVQLARRGFQVHLYERREEHMGAPAVGTSHFRSFPLGLNGRTLLSLKVAGLETQSLGPTAPPRKAVGVNRRLVKAQPSADPMRRLYFVDRLRLGQELVQAAREQKYPSGGAIHWHFGQALENVDFANKVATFVVCKPGLPHATSVLEGEAPLASSGTPRIQAEYDLLVGADGANSAMRAKMLRKVPGMTATHHVRALSSYKVFHGLEISPAIEKALTGITEQQPGEVVYFFRKLTPKHVGFSTLWKQVDGTLSGTVIGPYDWYSDDELEEQVDIVFRDGLDEWKHSVLRQIQDAAGQEPSHISTTYKLSQFHGPSCVLVGDAAHPVTPAMGQGCNCALESARVLAETLDRVGLEALPAAFTAARIKDAHANQDLDMQIAVVNVATPALLGPSKKPPTLAQRASATVEVVLPQLAYPFIRMLAPKQFPEPMLLFNLCGRHNLPYSQARFISRTMGWSVAAAGAATLVGLARMASTRLTASSQGARHA